MSVELGEVLVAQGLIDDAVLERAAAHQRLNGGSISRSLVELGLATERSIVETIAGYMGYPFADLSPGTLDPTAVALLSREHADRLTALPTGFTDTRELLVAIADVADTAALAEVEALTGLPVVPSLAVRSELLLAIAGVGMVETPPVNGSAPAVPEAAAQTDGTTNGSANGGANGASAPAVTVGHGSGASIAYEEEALLDLDGALLEVLQRGGSDLHLTAGLPPMIRQHGELAPLEGFPVLTPRELRKALYSILTQRQRETFENELELDVSYAIPGKARFRVNVFQQRDSVGSVMRLIPFELKSLEELGVPAQVANFAYLPRGFVLVTGPTGSGKSTTLAALIDLINRERAAHIMTIEDPIEFLHRHKRSVVNQRELGSDTHSFGAALKHVLRQDPDVILVGEMRDLETIQIALTAAETGHLVFGTLHTQDAPQTVDRIVDVFPPSQQEQIRVMLSGALQGVVCQQLLKTRDESSRVVACEVMVATSAIKNLIREGKTHQMYSSLQAGKSHGMISMDQSLANLVLKGTISHSAALERCSNIPDFNRLCGRA